MYCDVKTPDSLQNLVHTVCVHNNLCFVSVRVCVCVYMLRRLSTCSRMIYTRTRTCTYVHVRVHMYMYVYICTCTCTYVHVRVHMYMYVFSIICTLNMYVYTVPLSIIFAHLFNRSCIDSFN